jgi:hypothetical protein
MTIRAVEHWSQTGRFLVGGRFYNNTPPDEDEFHGLAQYNPSAQSDPPAYGWEPFGYPTVGDAHYWIEPEPSGDAYVTAIVEIVAPGKPLDKAVFVAGHFTLVQGEDTSTHEDLTFSAENCAWLNPEDGSFNAFIDPLGFVIPGPVFAFAQNTFDGALDGAMYLYFAGDSGEQPSGLPYPAVGRIRIDGSSPGQIEELVSNGYPYSGPLKAFNEPAVIYDLIVTREYLYAVGDFDLVADVGGPNGTIWNAWGLARFSFADARWSPLEASEGDELLNGIPFAGDADWPGVFFGGEFTAVDASIPSFHIGGAYYEGAVDAPVFSEATTVASVRLRLPKPNPSAGDTTIDFFLPMKMHVRVEVYDVTGRRVRALVEGTSSPGDHNVLWNGKGDDGQNVANGVYFVRLTSQQATLTERVVLLR